ncbi:MAG: hypothetical protein KAH25_01825 [Bacteroidales bacterium]|nr:hypothetical protein [Bacteroidales bacterium]
MTLQNRIKAFSALGNYLRVLLKNDMQPLDKDELKSFTDNIADLNKLQDRLIDYSNHSKHYNAWFTKEAVLFTLSDWSDALQEHKLEEWLMAYDIPESFSSKTVAIVMAGNIPMVGFHDYLSIVLSGHKVLAKLSSDDEILIPLLHDILSVFEPEMKTKAIFTKDQLKNFDAIIATGSDNTSRYFDYYFSKYPNIIRKNRSGVAVLTGQETNAELEGLADDILTYFGLGCRSISKLYIPKGFEFINIFKTLETREKVSLHHKFFNNYEYNKAIYLVNRTIHRDTGFMLFKEDTALSSPISVIYFQEYSNDEELKTELTTREKEIQCIIGKNYIPFGKSQHPQLNDYADGVDTIRFLLSLG